MTRFNLTDNENYKQHYFTNLKHEAWFVINLPNRYMTPLHLVVRSGDSHYRLSKVKTVEFWRTN